MRKPAELLPVLTDIADELPLAIPVIVRHVKGGETVIKYDPKIPGIESVLVCYADQYAAYPLCDRALDYLFKTVTDRLYDMGYRTDPHGRKKWLYAFVCDDAKALALDRVLPGTVKLTEEMLSLPNRTTVNPEMLLACGFDAFVTVECGEIVSVASVNPGGSEECAEINIQTAPDYRSRGFGVSNVVALCEYLLTQGKTVLYEASCHNSRSTATARAAGLREEARLYMIPCYYMTRFTLS